MLTRIEASILEGTWKKLRDELQLRNRGKTTVKEFTERYMRECAAVRNKPRTHQRKKSSFKFLEGTLGNLELEDVTPDKVNVFVNKRKKAGASNSTINRDLAALKHMMNFAVECGVIELNPIVQFKNLKAPQKPIHRFSEQEVQAVIDQLRADCKPIPIFVKETGCRVEEALSLQHWQVQIRSRLVVFTEDTKSSKFRYVPLTDEAIEAVQALPRLPDCPYVFYNVNTRDRWHRMQTPWYRAREKAGVPGIRLQDLRAHYAIRLAESGVDMHDIKQMLGHSSVMTTERHYAQFSPKRSASRVLKVLQGGKAVELKRNLKDDH